MIRKFVMCAFMALMATSLSAQENPNVVYKVAVGEVNHKSKAAASTGETIANVASALLAGSIKVNMANYTDDVRAKMVSAISNVRRFNAVDSEADDADYSFSATLVNMTVVTHIEPPTENRKYPEEVFKATMSVIVNMKDVKTGEIAHSVTINVAEYDFSWVKSQEESINQALTYFGRKLTKHFNVKYPQRGNVIERGGEKRDKQKEIYIDMGDEDRVVVGQHFRVFTVKTVAGREAKKEIGKVVVREVMGDDISICKVQSGGANIKTAMDNDEKVVVQSLD